MSLLIRLAGEQDAAPWEAWVESRPEATLYHCRSWLDVISRTYGHRAYPLLALDAEGAISGLLPLVGLRHPLFGSALVSLPFVDHAGPLGSTDVVEALLGRAESLRRALGLATLDVRAPRPLPGDLLSGTGGGPGPKKVRMLLRLRASSEALMASFKAKLRSQIRRPLKEGLQTRSGGAELLEAFYTVFLQNMRDLGSPVHSPRLFAEVLAAFPGKARIFVVTRGGEPVAGSVGIGFGDTFSNPWASSLRKYREMSPNMLLYWSMLAYAADNGYGVFDFGRSTRGEGTYLFKRQWGATEHPLFWYASPCSGRAAGTGERARFEALIPWWQRLPVPVTRFLGPLIRKHIGL